MKRVLKVLFFAFSIAASAQLVAAPLQSTAREIINKSSELASIWPGFWSDHPTFGLYNRDGDALLVKNGRTMAANIDAAITLQEFTIAFPVDHETTTTAVLVEESASFADITAILMHESYHQWRLSQNWIHRTSVAPYQSVDTELAALKLAENQLLLDAIASDSNWLDLAARFVLARENRYRQMNADLQRREDGWETREGLAFYVEAKTRALLTEQSAVGFIRSHYQALTPKSMPSLDMVFSRWWSYSIGASIAMLMDRCDAEWKSHWKNGDSLFYRFNNCLQHKSLEPVNSEAIKQLAKNWRKATPEPPDPSDLGRYELVIPDVATLQFRADAIVDVDDNHRWFDAQSLTANDPAFTLHIEDRWVLQRMKQKTLSVFLRKPPKETGCDWSGNVAECPRGAKIHYYGDVDIVFHTSLRIQRSGSRYTITVQSP